MGRKKAGRAGFSCPECLTGQAGEPEGYGWFPGTVTEGESSELQCQRSDKKSKCAGKWGYAVVTRSFIIRQILVTVLGTGNIEMSTMDSFFALMELAFYGRGGRQ